jgi:hypothetical protein
MGETLVRMKAIGLDFENRELGYICSGSFFLVSLCGSSLTFHWFSFKYQKQLLGEKGGGLVDFVNQVLNVVILGATFWKSS